MPLSRSGAKSHRYQKSTGSPVTAPARSIGWGCLGRRDCECAAGLRCWASAYFLDRSLRLKRRASFASRRPLRAKYAAGFRSELNLLFSSRCRARSSNRSRAFLKRSCNSSRSPGDEYGGGGLVEIVRHSSSISGARYTSRGPAHLMQRDPCCALLSVMAIKPQDVQIDATVPIALSKSMRP